MTPKQIYYQNIAGTIIVNLQKRQMEGFYCPDRASAVEKALVACRQLWYNMTFR